MKRPSYLNQAIVAALIIFAVLGCRYTTTTKTARSEPKAAVAPITIGSDLAVIDLCAAIPKEDIEAVMGRKLINAPKHFEFYDTAGTSGCSYDGGKDSDGEAHYGYVVLTPLDVYDKQPLYKNVSVRGIGDTRMVLSRSRNWLWQRSSRSCRYHDALRAAVAHREGGLTHSSLHGESRVAAKCGVAHKHFAPPGLSKID